MNCAYKDSKKKKTKEINRQKMKQIKEIIRDKGLTSFF